MAAVMVAVIGIGGFGVHSLQAQANLPVYMIEDNGERPRRIREGIRALGT